MGRIFLLTLAGLLGGLLAWAICEPSAPNAFADAAWGRWEAMFGAVSGALIGLLLGACSGMAQGSKTHLARGAIFGLLLGLVGGPLGISLGQQFYSLIGGPGAGAGLSISNLAARAMGFAAFGTILGAAQGVVGLSLRRSVLGALGGLIGGAAGGVVFELSALIVAPMTSAVQGGDEAGTIPRLLGIMAVGAGIGLFVGIVEALGRQAWVRLVLGRNEGKEWAIDAPQTFLGRSEKAHIPLFGDPNVVPMHASIIRQGGTYFLIDGGSPVGTGLNGMRVDRAPLTAGDVIHIGKFQLQFLLRSGKAQRVVDPQRFQPQPYPQMPAGAGQQTVGIGAPTAMMSQPTQAMAPAPPQSPTSLTLVAQNGPIAGMRYPVTGPLEIGREATGINLSFDTMASRKHAAIAPGTGVLSVQDLGSTNGTMLNGNKITAHSAGPGDTLQIGNTVFRIE